jgi:hypothetical protein
VRAATESDQQVGEVHAQLLGVLRVQRVLGVDEGTHAVLLLHLGNDLQGQRGLAGRFRAVDLDHAAAGQAAHAKGDVQAQRTGGNHLDVLNDFAFAQPHDGALAELLFDLAQRGLQGLGFFGHK